MTRFSQFTIFQAISEKVSITDLLEVRGIGIPHDTQVKMTRVWEEHERFTPDKRKDCPIPQWYGKEIRYDGYELDESLKKARFYEPPHLTILDKVLLTNTKMTKVGKPTNKYVFVPLDYHYDDEIAIMHMSNYSHLVPGISRELRNSSCVWCNHDANTRNVNDLDDLEAIDSNDSRQDYQELPRPISSMV